MGREKVVKEIMRMKEVSLQLVWFVIRGQNVAPRKAESQAWWRQAVDDRLFAQSALRDGRFSHVCVLCQQASEKAVKSIYRAKGMAFPHSHLISEMCRTLHINGKLKLAASVLDQY